MDLFPRIQHVSCQEGSTLQVTQAPRDRLRGRDSFSTFKIVKSCFASRSSSNSAVHPIHRAPILALTNCWGVSRPPLLPTPSQFPPCVPSSLSLPPLSLSKLALSPVQTPSTSVVSFTFPDVVAAARETVTEPRRSRTDTECSTTPSISELEAR